MVDLSQFTPAARCERYFQDALHAKKHGRQIIYPSDPEVRKCFKQKLSQHEKLEKYERVKQYDPLARKLVLGYPVITDAELRKKIHEKLPNDLSGQQYVYSLVRDRAYRATAFSTAQLHTMTKFMESTTQENQNRHRRRLEKLPKLQAASERNNLRRVLLRKPNGH